VARNAPPEHGTLIVSAYLLLGLAFAGTWIFSYAGRGHAPWELMPWFGGAAVGITVWAIADWYLRSR